jgi:hypothetical protein
MNDLSHGDRGIVDRLNAELSAIPVPARPSRSARRQTSGALPTLLVIAAVIVAVAIGALRFLPATSDNTASQVSVRLATTTPPITSGDLMVKTQVTILSLGRTSFTGKITDQNLGDQRVWNGRVVAIHVTDQTVYPNLGVTQLADAKLKPGDTVTLTFVPSEYDPRTGSYPALVVGRESLSSSFPCPVTSTRDASGVITASGNLGLIEIHPATFPGEKVIVLVRRGAQEGDTLGLRAEPVPQTGGLVMWSTPATPRATAWGSVVFEVNTKPIGNMGCWHLVSGDFATTDPGIVVDLGR